MCVRVDKRQHFRQNVKSFDTGVEPNRISGRVECKLVWEYFTMNSLISKVRGYCSENAARITGF